MSDGSGKARRGKRRPARSRRTKGLIAVLVTMVVFGGVAAIARVLGNTERVTAMWVGAEIAADGSARITEVIDYDFGEPDRVRHGIHRDLPHLADGSEHPVHATMDGVHVPYEITVGDYRTIDGLHRYRVQDTSR
jgi:hypothetical protein